MCPEMAGLRVSALRESPRRPGRFELRLSDGSEFVVGVGTLADLSLASAGATIDTSALEALRRESAITLLMDRALDSMARSRKTRKELELRLRRKEQDQQLIRIALDRLEAAGLLSDTDTAHAEVRARLGRGEASSRIRQILRRKGVDDRVVSDAISEGLEEAISAGYDEYASCLAIAQRRIRNMASLPEEVARRRLSSFLLRRGFSTGIVRKALSEVMTPHD